MKGKCSSHLPRFIWGCNIFDIYKSHRQCISMRILFTVTIFLYFVQLSKCQSTSQSTTTVQNETDHEISPKVVLFNASSVPTVILSNSEEDYSSEYYYEEDNNSTGNGRFRKQDKSKTAQVIIYLLVIFIALGGILIKYFVTEYETSQIKAQEQLNYHRLHNQA